MHSPNPIVPPPCFLKPLLCPLLSCCAVQVVIEQEDWPTVLRNRTADCPDPGPLVAPAKQTGNDSHAHALLAPDHSFAGWPEARTLSWAEMLPLLQRAGEEAWDLAPGGL